MKKIKISTIKPEKMKTRILLLMLLISCNLLIAQKTDTASINLFDLSLEELLNLEITVASTKGDNYFTTPSTVTVITKDDIERFGFSALTEVLQSVPGFSVERTDLRRNIPTGRGVLQSHYANKNLILINGIPSWNAVTGEANLDRINIYDIERIEVLKGPASVLYGTNAYTGAVNIILKQVKESNVTLHAGYGTLNSYDAGVGISLKKNDFESYISINSSNNKGPGRKFTDDRNITGDLSDFLKSNNANIYLKYKSHAITANLFQAEESYYGFQITYASGAGIPHLVNGLLVNYTFNHNLTDKLNLIIGGYYDYGSRDFSRLANDSVRAAVIGYRANAFFKTNYSFNERISLEIGADIGNRYSIANKTYINETDSTTTENGMANIGLVEYSAFAQLQAKFNKLSLLAGGRYTYNKLFGSDFSPRITGVYAINDKNSIKAIYGKSYRNPALLENYFFLPTAVFGNEKLKPETAQSFELVYVTSFDKFFVQALAYHSIYNSKIIRTKDTTIILSDGKTLKDYPQATVYTNGDPFSASGVEFELKYANLRIINAFINFDYVLGNDGDLQNTTIIRTNAANQRDTIVSDIYNFRFVPKMTLTAGLQRDIFKGLGVSAVYTYFGARGAVKPDIAAQSILDLSLSFKHKIGNSKLIHSISCKNLLDTNVLIPEYTRLRNVNAIPFGTYRYISYTLRFDLK